MKLILFYFYIALGDRDFWLWHFIHSNFRQKIAFLLVRMGSVTAEIRNFTSNFYMGLKFSRAPFVLTIIECTYQCLHQKKKNTFKVYNGKQGWEMVIKLIMISRFQEVSSSMLQLYITVGCWQFLFSYFKFQIFKFLKFLSFQAGGLTPYTVWGQLLSLLWRSRLYEIMRLIDLHLAVFDIYWGQTQIIPYMGSFWASGLKGSTYQESRSKIRNLVPRSLLFG